MERRPLWLQELDGLTLPVFRAGLLTLNPEGSPNFDQASRPYLALCHIASCIEEGGRANLKGHHAVSICLLRQCIEAVTIMDVGLQTPEFRDRLLDDWANGSRTTGNLRQELERHVWPRYGPGLWAEPWTEFMTNLSRAVQPYAHYSLELQGWQHQDVHAHLGERYGLTAIGPGTYDAIKASRVTLLQALITWTIARMLVLTGHSDVLGGLDSRITAWGREIGRSKLLFHEGKWSEQLLPHIIFRQEADWRDI
jgi:hypothetical protein